MVHAYIIFPDVCLDSLGGGIEEVTTSSRLFLTKLMNEKERVSTVESKRFRGFIAPYHLNKLIDVIVNFINSKDKEITDDEINLIQIILASLEREGIEGYPYQDNYTPTLDLATDKFDSYDVVIVCNNVEITTRLKEKMKNFSHLKNCPIMTAGEAMSFLPK